LPRRRAASLHRRWHDVAGHGTRPSPVLEALGSSTPNESLPHEWK